MTWRNGRLGFVAIGFVLSVGACAHAPSHREEIAPKVRWVLAEVQQSEKAMLQVVGRPRIHSEGQAAMLEFDGREDALILATDPLEGLPRFTIEVLIRPDGDGPPEQRFFHTEDKEGRRVLVELRLDRETRRWCLDTYLHASAEERRTLIDRAKTHPTGEWYWVALVYDGTTMAHYVRAMKELEGPVRFPAMSTGETSIGVRLNRVAWFKGAIQEVRIYDQPLALHQLSR